MAHIFYFFALLIAIYEIFWFLQTSKLLDLTNSLNNKTIEKDDNQKIREGIFALSLLFVFFITFFGLLTTYNWFAFLLYIGFNIISSLIFKPFKETFLYMYLIKFKSLGDFFFWILIIINYYHLNIDMYQFFLSLIN